MGPSQPSDFPDYTCFWIANPMEFRHLFNSEIGIVDKKKGGIMSFEPPISQYMGYMILLY